MSAPGSLLFVLYSLGAGGAERVTSTLANHWAGQGWRVTLVTLCGDEADFYPLHPAITRVCLRQAAPSAGPWAAVLANLGRCRALRRVLRQQRPQVAVAMMASANVLLALAGWGLPDLVTVGSERIHPPQLPLGRLWGALRWAAYGLLGAVVAQTERSAAWIRQHTRARRVVVIENPLPPALPARSPLLDPAAWLAPHERLLLAVGRLEPQKGFDLLVEAFAALADRHPLWRLVVVGEGDERSALERRCQRFGLGERVLLPGRAGNINAWYARADLFVLSSRFEGFPNVLAEAMAAGLAVVSANCPTGPADLVRDGIDGVLVPAEDAAALARALDPLMADDHRRQRLGAQARHLASRLDPGFIAARWEALFAQLGAGVA